MRNNLFVENIKTQFSSKNIVVKLLLINIIIWCILLILRLFIDVNNIILPWISVPSNIFSFIIKPWTIITYMFVQYDFMHLLGNMLWLFFLGNLYLSFVGKDKFLATYILGGISGAVLFILTYNIFPLFQASVANSICMGASASITAIIMATAILQPNFQVFFFGLFPIKLKWIAFIYFIYDLTQITGGNAGGHIAHLGGAIFGIILALQLKRNNNITLWFTKIINYFQNFKFPKIRKKNTFKVYKNNIPKDDKIYNQQKFNEKKEHEQKINNILEKISKSGYKTLTKSEKEYLFTSGKK